MTNTEILVPIHGGLNRDRVVKFIPLDSFAEEFQNQYNNNYIYTCYYDDNGDIVAVDVWGDVHKLELVADQLHEVVNEHGEVMSAGTYMECLAYLNAEGKNKNYTINKI